MPACTPSDRLHLVYGYIRIDAPDEIEIALLRKEMTIFCEERRYRLVTVCCDRGDDGLTISRRPGLTAALDVLPLPDSYGLVVPTLDHLSPDLAIRDGVKRVIQRAGATLLVLGTWGDAHDNADHRTALGIRCGVRPWWRRCWRDVMTSASAPCYRRDQRRQVR